LTAAAELSARHINDRHLPDKAIDVIDEAGAAQRLLPRSKQKKVIGKTEIESIVSKIARIPPQTVSSDDRSKLATLERDLKTVVYGQDNAIEALAAAIKMARSGLGRPEKPIGAFLFSGPTGVGKTEVARQLAFTLGVELLRFDMSEYMERHTVSRLIGAPPGYVGFDQGGLLTEAVTKQPHCVLLLDEIEKAHPDVFNLLLQVLDDGHMTDGLGRKIDFKNTILIMTSNIGARQLQEFGTGVGFGTKAKEESKEENSKAVIQNALRKAFSPEFLNRVDDMIMFRSLTREDIHKIIDLELDKLILRIKTLGYNLELTEKAKDFIVERGYDEKFGARPLKRAIQKFIEDPLAEGIINHNMAEGDTVLMDFEDGKEELNLAVKKQKGKKSNPGKEG
jgi:ATP-dependent Clp protease ATP-binding subunit ClpA